jgi:DNA-binding transcriptional ArsR family regulator
MGDACEAPWRADRQTCWGQPARISGARCSTVGQSVRACSPLDADTEERSDRMAPDLRRTVMTPRQRDQLRLLKAVSSGKRLQILDWLRDPRAHFPEQADGDLVEDGVCGVFIARKLGISQPTAHAHLKALADAGLIEGKRIKQWTFFKRNEEQVARISALLEKL